MNLLGTFTLVFVALATPGPNNLFMTRAAAASGMRATVPAAIGVALGGLAMLLLSHVGLATVLLGAPELRQAILVAGSAVLIYGGLRIVASAHRRQHAPELHDGSAPAGVAALFLFQFVNPKAWTLSLTIAAAMPASIHSGADAVAVSAIYACFLLVSMACNLGWAAFGQVASRWLGTAARRTHFDRAMGLLLAGSAGLFLLQP